MQFKNLYDMHTHSDHSFDGNHSCMRMCEEAVKKALCGIAITDHCEIDSKDADFRALCCNQFVETFKVKKYFSDSLLVMQGIELGQPIYKKELAQSILNKYDYDFVLGSVHNLPDMEDFYFLDFKEYNIYNLLEQYFEKILELACWNQFDSLAHLTYPFRYIVAREQIKIDMSGFQSVTDEIFHTLIANNKALEINTSGLAMEINDTLPDLSLVKRFRELGGQYVTVGSDSHYADKIGSFIDRGMAVAKQAGFDYITIYQKRNPQLIPIE